MERLAARVVGGQLFVDKSWVRVFQLGLHNRVDEMEGTSALVPDDLESSWRRLPSATMRLMMRSLSKSRMPPTAARLLPKNAKH